MAVRIGKIELVGLSRVSTEDTRSLVKQRGPGQAGGLFQDLGREPVTIVLEGILLGDDAQSALEELRHAHANAKPMSFAADAIAGADLTHVLIADLEVRQLAGHASRFSFFLRVREHTEPPESPSEGAAAVDAVAKEDAKKWQQGAVDAAAVKQDPGSLVEAIDKNPDLVTHLDGNELGELTAANADAMSGEQFGAVLGAVGAKNPAAMTSMVDTLKAKGRFGALLAKLYATGVNVLNYLKTIKIGAIIALFKMIAGGGELVKQLKVVGEKAEAVGAKLSAFDIRALLADLESERTKPPPEGKLDLCERAQAYKSADNPFVWVWEKGAKVPSAPVPSKGQAAAPNQTAEIIKAVAELVKAINDLMQTDTFKGFMDLVKELHLQSIVAPILRVISTVLLKVVDFIRIVKHIVALPRVFEPLMLFLEEVELMSDMSPKGRKEELEEYGWGMFVPIAEGTNVVISQLTRLHRIAVTVTGAGQVEQGVKQIGDSVSALQKTFDGYATKLEAAASSVTSASSSSSSALTSATSTASSSISAVSGALG